MMSGEDLRRARERVGLSQEALGRIMGVTGKTVRNWESRPELTSAMEARVKKADELWQESENIPRLSDLSDIALLAEMGAIMSEVATRFDTYRAAVGRFAAAYDPDAVGPSRDNIDTKDTPKDSDGSRKVPGTGAQVAGSSGSAANPRKRPDDTE